MAFLLFFVVHLMTYDPPLGTIGNYTKKQNDEMVDIMAHMHSTYQSLSLQKTFMCHACRARSFPIIVAGSQLTAARARGANKVKCNSDSSTSRFEGLIPTAID